MTKKYRLLQDAMEKCYRVRGLLSQFSAFMAHYASGP